METGSTKSALIAAVLIVILGVMAFPRLASANPEATSFGVSPLGIVSLVTAVGDDAFATTDLSSLTAALDPATPTQHYGPYASGSTDSGTCGNDWANDLFNRHFTVFSHPDGTYTIVEQFKDGSFTTPASDSPPVNFSPGACENSPVPQGVVNAGVTGSLHGYFIVPLPPGEIQTSNDPSCVAGNPTAPCTTTGFIDSHFTPCYFGGSGACPVTTFFDHYVAPGQGLIVGEWKNASADRGGNHGDIRSANI
jgi:hypothetical protein